MCIFAPYTYQDMKHHYTYESSIGPLCICEEDGYITRINTAPLACPSEDWKEEETPLIREAHRQLTEYFRRERRAFDLPLRPCGTDFQQRVWQSLRKIPYGEVRSYKQIAEAIGCPKGVRAVGGACNRNHILFAIPCHRVIGADGRLVGFAAGVEYKEFLLRLEGSLL